MNKNLLFIVVISIVMGVSSCKRDSIVEQPASFAKLMLENKIPEQKIYELKLDGKTAVSNFLAPFSQLVVDNSTHRLELYDPENNSVIFDTTFIVSKQNRNNYMFFRADTTEKMQLLEAINTDTVALPRDGYIKLSLANFTKHIPSSIKLELLFLQYNDDGGLDTAAIWNDPGKKFSLYTELKLNTYQGELNRDFIVIMRDGITMQEISLMTDPVTGEIIDVNGSFRVDASDYPQKRIYTYYIFTERLQDLYWSTTFGNF